MGQGCRLVRAHCGPSDCCELYKKDLACSGRADWRSDTEATGSEIEIEEVYVANCGCFVSGQPLAAWETSCTAVVCCLPQHWCYANATKQEQHHEATAKAAAAAVTAETVAASSPPCVQHNGYRARAMTTTATTATATRRNTYKTAAV